MKTNRPLSPSIESIDHRLFGVSEALMAAVEAGRVSPAIAEAVRCSPEWVARSVAEDASPELLEAVISPMPAKIRLGIERKLAARDAFGSERRDPDPGQVVEVREIITPRPGQLDWVMQVPLYVLLDAPAETESVWHGWLASAETDYAGWWDFVLQQEDMPFDPEAGVVHLWNPVRLYLPMANRIVAQLAPKRLQAVRALAADYLVGEVPQGTPVWPGRVALRETAVGLAVATGSPLGGDEDPRHRFQHLYHYAAEAIREPARLAMASAARSPATAGLHAFLSRLIEAAKGSGILTPVPRVNLAMSREDSHPTDVTIGISAKRADASPAPNEDAQRYDLHWEQNARISILEIKDDGSGVLTVAAGRNVPVTCELLIAGLLEEKVVATPDSPVTIAWEAGNQPMLVLQMEEGHRLELQLAD